MHDDVEAEPPRLGERLDAGGAAIDGDEQLRAAPGERADRLDVGAVAFEDAVRDMHDRLGAAEPQEARQQRRGGGAVDVVVAEDRDLLAACTMASASRCAACSMAVTVCGSGISRRTVGSRKASTSSTSTPRPARMRASSSGTCAAARWRARAPMRALVEPVAPGTAADRALDAQEQARRRLLAAKPARPS